MESFGILLVVMFVLGRVVCRISKDDYMKNQTGEGNYNNDDGAITNEYNNNSTEDHFISTELPYFGSNGSDYHTNYGYHDNNNYEFHEDAYSTDYILRFHMGVSTEEVEEFLKSNSTQQFLYTFPPGLERDLMYEQLRSCPFTSRCDTSSDEYTGLSEYFDFKPCCAQCSCVFPDCLFLRTCCLEVLLAQTDIITELSSEKDQTNLQCVPSRISSNRDLEVSESSSKITGALMFASCPSRVDKALEINCTRNYTPDLYDLKDITPVIDILTSTVYRNVYCAYCHGVEDEHLNQAKIKFKCFENSTQGSQQDMIKAALGDGTCNIDFSSPDDFKFRSCDVTVTSCNVSEEWKQYNSTIEHLCKFYTNAVNVPESGQYYNNIFCAMCNGITISSYSCFYGAHHEIALDFSFSGLLKLESGVNADGGANRENDCSEEQLYDYIHGTCRDLICSPLMTLQHGQCVEMFSEIFSIKYTMYLRIKPIENITMYQAYHLAGDINKYIKNIPILEEPCILLLDFHVKKSVCNLSLEDQAFRPLSFFQSHINLVKTYKHDPYILYDRLLMLHSTSHRIEYYDIEQRRIDTLHVEFEVLDERVDHSDVDVYNMTLPNFEFECFNLDQFDRELNILQLAPCVKVPISKSEIPWTQTEAGIKLTEAEMVINNNEFYFNGSGDVIIVCVDIYNRYMLAVHDTSYSTMTVVSIICSIISLVSLLFTLIVFLVLPKLRKNIPGKNNLSLVIALMCAQSLYLVSGMAAFEAGSTLCIVFGMFLHFSWLLAMFWMNVCTFHMFHVLTRTQVMSRTSGKYRLVLYHLYAVAMSAMLVGINAIVSITSSGSYGYGDMVCYISSQNMIGYTFGIPVAAVILCNLCMYVVVVCKIGMTPSVQKNVKNERNNFLIFVKLSTITGATWLFGLINYWVDVTILSYLFILLNATQGVFIMCAFILNHRVLNLFRSQVLGQDVTITDTESKKTTQPTAASSDQ